MEYNIKTHIHLYSSWAASTAARASKLNRFNVETGQKILENATIRKLILNPESLPEGEVEFDEEHRIWREEIISFSSEFAEIKFTHGVAAKLINVYLKSIIICGGFHKHNNSKFIHPPIDSILLKALATKDFNGNATFWRRAQNNRWSKFDSNFYQSVVDEIRNGLNGAPL